MKMYKCRLYCNNVRIKEGSGQGWLVETRVILLLFLINLNRTLCVLGTSTLSVVSAITLCVRSGCLSRHRPCARVSTPSISELPFHGGFYPVSTPITAIRHRCSSFCTWPTYLPPSPESFSRCRLRWTTPPSSHTPTARLRPGSPPACSPPPPPPHPPPHFWKGSRPQSSASPACGSPWIWRVVMPDTNGWSVRWYLYAVEPLQGRVVRTEGEFPSQEIIVEGADRPPNRQTLLFNGAVHRLSLRELSTDVQHRALLTPYLLGQDGSQPPVRCVRLQQEGERKVRRV